PLLSTLFPYTTLFRSYLCSTRTRAYIASAAIEGSHTNHMFVPPHSHVPPLPTATISARNTTYRAPLLEISFRYKFALRNNTQSCPLSEKCGRIPSYQ